MNSYKLQDFTKGWFIGNFEPTLFDGDFEVGIKEYKFGDKEERHLHKLSKESALLMLK